MFHHSVVLHWQSNIDIKQQTLTTLSSNRAPRPQFWDDEGFTGLSIVPDPHCSNTEPQCHHTSSNPLWGHLQHPLHIKDAYVGSVTAQPEAGPQACLITDPMPGRRQHTLGQHHTLRNDLSKH